MMVPDFGHYKRATPAAADPKDADYSRRAFTYLLTGSAAVVGLQMGKSIVQDFLNTMSASVRQGEEGEGKICEGETIRLPVRTVPGIADSLSQLSTG